MNIFLPYENDIIKSVQTLDDKRLRKQILECREILDKALKFFKNEDVGGYSKHPIFEWYKKYPNFVAYYGDCCVEEYEYRFEKKHAYADYFKNTCILSNHYVPYYAEGSLGQSNYIRTYENVSELFKNKLIKKWNEDVSNNRPPKWTKRETPEFYKQGVNNER